MAEYDESLSDDLSLTEARGCSVEFNEVASDAMGLSEPPFVEVEDLHDDLSFTDEVVVAFPEDVSDDLDLTEALTDTHSMLVQDSLSLIESMDDNAVYSESLSDSLALTEQAVGWMVRPGQPQGESVCDDSYLAIRNISSQEDVSFSCEDPELEVVLHPPEFGNVDSLDTQALIRKNQGGEYDIARPSEWVNFKTFKLEWVGLKDDKVVELLDFLSQTSGLEVTFRDHQNLSWLGVITTPVDDVVRGRGDCTNEVSLDFQVTQELP